MLMDKYINIYIKIDIIIHQLFNTQCNNGWIEQFKAIYQDILKEIYLKINRKNHSNHYKKNKLKEKL